MEYLVFIKDNILHVVAILGMFGIGMELTPWVKFNPYSVMLKWIGNTLLGETREDISNIKKDMEETKKSIDEISIKVDSNEIDRIRKEISDFADSLRRGESHTKDQFERVIKIHDKYNALLEANHKTNGVINTEYKYINKMYLQLSERSGFLV